MSQVYSSLVLCRKLLLTEYKFSRCFFPQLETRWLMASHKWSLWNTCSTKDCGNIVSRLRDLSSVCVCVLTLSAMVLGLWNWFLDSWTCIISIPIFLYWERGLGLTEWSPLKERHHTFKPWHILVAGISNSSYNYTPENSHGSHPVEKENPLPYLHYWVPC